LRASRHIVNEHSPAPDVPGDRPRARNQDALVRRSQCAAVAQMYLAPRSALFVSGRTATATPAGFHPAAFSFIRWGFSNMAAQSFSFPRASSPPPAWITRSRFLSAAPPVAQPAVFPTLFGLLASTYIDTQQPDRAMNFFFNTTNWRWMKTARFSGGAPPYAGVISNSNARTRAVFESHWLASWRLSPNRCGCRRRTQAAPICLPRFNGSEEDRMRKIRCSRQADLGAYCDKAKPLADVAELNGRSRRSGSTAPLSAIGVQHHQKHPKHVLGVLVHSGLCMPGGTATTTEDYNWNIIALTSGSRLREFKSREATAVSRGCPEPGSRCRISRLELENRGKVSWAADGAARRRDKIYNPMPGFEAEKARAECPWTAYFQGSALPLNAPEWRRQVNCPRRNRLSETCPLSSRENHRSPSCGNYLTCGANLAQLLRKISAARHRNADFRVLRHDACRGRNWEASFRSHDGAAPSHPDRQHDGRKPSVSLTSRQVLPCRKRNGESGSTVEQSAQALCPEDIKNLDWMSPENAGRKAPGKEVCRILRRKFGLSPNVPGAIIRAFEIVPGI